MNIELKLGLLGLGPGFQDLYIGGLLVVVLENLPELVVDFEVASWNNLENGISIVLEVKNVPICLIHGLTIRKTLSGEQSKVLSILSLVALNTDALSEFQVGICLFF